METYWANNRDAMLAYMGRVLTTGVKGIVTDAATGLPLAATVSVQQIGNPIISDTEVGDYHRLLNAGTYTLTFTKNGYNPVTLTNVVVVNGQMTVRDVQMSNPSGVEPDSPAASLALERPSPNPSFPAHGQAVRIGFHLPEAGAYRAAIYDATGREVRVLAQQARETAGRHELTWDGLDGGGRRVSGGLYWVRLSAGGREVEQKLALIP
jgi:hypothetical protein